MLRFGDAFWVAWKQREIRDLRPLSLRAIGEEVSAATGRRENYRQETVRGWRRGSKPDDYVIRAIAKVLGCREEELVDAAPGAQTLPRKPREVVARRKVAVRLHRGR